ncbi:MAG: OB-fold nucleic acid binding domain-containing protein, partial [Candidatus Binatia bacterium]
MSESLGDWQRSVSCGELGSGDVGREATVMGWVHARRDHGGLVFLDVRDRTGIIQVVFHPESSAEAHRRAGEARGEFVVAVQGRVAARSEETRNPNLPTGDVEIDASEIRILN